MKSINCSIKTRPLEFVAGCTYHNFIAGIVCSEPSYQAYLHKFLEPNPNIHIDPTELIDSLGVHILYHNNGKMLTGGFYTVAIEANSLADFKRVGTHYQKEVQRLRLEQGSLDKKIFDEDLGFLSGVHFYDIVILGEAVSRSYATTKVVVQEDSLVTDSKKVQKLQGKGASPIEVLKVDFSALVYDTLSGLDISRQKSKIIREDKSRRIGDRRKKDN